MDGNYNDTKSKRYHLNARTGAKFPFLLYSEQEILSTGSAALPYSILVITGVKINSPTLKT